MAVAARDKAHVVNRGAKKEKNGNNQKEEKNTAFLNRNKLSWSARSAKELFFSKKSRNGDTLGPVELIV